MVQTHMPIGYKLVNGKIEVDRDKTNTVKKIFSDYLNDKSMLAISNDLKEKDILNANNKTNWTHVSIGKILQNVKYRGDDFYPAIIDEDAFLKAQEIRKTREINLGRTALQNTMKKQSIFNNKIKCGECGDYYKKYAEHAGRKSEKKKWKCKNYLVRNKVFCRNLFYTDDELKAISTDAVNELIKKKWMLEKTKSKEPPKISLELRQVEERIKELETEQEFSSSELSLLIFKRAEFIYKGSKIDDHKSNTEKIKVVLKYAKEITEFDTEIFETVIKQITVFKNYTAVVEFINGITITENLEYKRKDKKDGSSEKDGSDNTSTNKIR